MFTPLWVFDVASARTAYEYLSAEMGVDAYAKKYAEGLSEHYNEIKAETFLETATNLLEFLSEVEAGEQAAVILNDYCYFKMYFEQINRPRKMKLMFGSIEDGSKNCEYNPAITLKSFRAYVFGLRSEAVPVAPKDWKLEDDVHIVNFKKIVLKTVSILDAL
jgi:hypothetical protein